MMAAATGTLALKVTLADTWRQLQLAAASDETVAQLKLRALAAEAVPEGRAGDYEVKFGGALVRDESRTLAAAGIPDGGALVILARRRRAVR
jgi:hypothetical protein